MENKDPIPYYAFEAANARFDRVHLRDHIVIILLIVLFVATNFAWAVYESQWQCVDTTSISQEVDAGEGGTATINDGVHINGESETDSNKN